MNIATDRKQAILDRVADDWSPRHIRELATSLMRLADSLDQEWDPSNVKSIFRWPDDGRRIERNALNLAHKAKVIYAKRGSRRKYIPGELLVD